MKRQSGFTLIEMVLVMVIISVGVLGLSGMFATASKALVTNESLQQLSQYAQQCAEQVIAVRRNDGFGSTQLTTSLCGSSPSGVTRSLTIGSAYTGTSTSACPNTVSCKDVLVTVTNNANNALTTSVTVMLVNY